MLKGDGSRKSFTYTVRAEKRGTVGVLRGLNPTAAWYRHRPEQGIRRIVVTLGKEERYRSDEPEPPNSGPRPGIAIAEVREPSYGTENLVPGKRVLDSKMWKWDADWRAMDGTLSAKRGWIHFLPYSGSDCCVQLDVKDPGDPATKVGVLFRANDAGHYVLWLGVHPYRNAVLEEARAGRRVRRKGYWTFVTPPPDKWYRLKLEVGGGTIRFSFDHDLDGDFTEPFGRAYKGPITYTTRAPAFHSGDLSAGRIGLVVDSPKQVLFRNLGIYGDRRTQRGH